MSYLCRPIVCYVLVFQVTKLAFFENLNKKVRRIKKYGGFYGENIIYLTNMSDSCAHFYTPTIVFFTECFGYSQFLGGNILVLKSANDRGPQITEVLLQFTLLLLLV